MNGFNRRTIIVSIVILTVMVFVLAVAVVGQRLAASGTGHRITEQKRLLARYQRQKDQYCKARKDYEASSVTLGGRLPECSWTDQMPFMIAQLEGITIPRGVKVETLQPQPTVTYRKVMRFPMRVGLQADLPTLTLLLEGLQKTSPVLEVDRLDVRNGQEGDKLQVDMTLSSFVVLDPNAPVAKRRLIRAAKVDLASDDKKPTPPTATPQSAKPSGPPPNVAASPVAPVKQSVQPVVLEKRFRAMEGETEAIQARKAARRARLQAETPADSTTPQKTRKRLQREDGAAPPKPKPPSAPVIAPPANGDVAPKPAGEMDVVPQKVPNGGAR